MTPEEQLAALRTEAAAFHDSVHDLDLLVPACGPWRVRDLVRHLGSVHRMFRRVADEGLMTRPPVLVDDDRPEAGDAAVADWAGRETGALLVALERLDPASPRWNFTDGPQLGSFIFRRMLHETAVHRHDVQDAHGHAESIDAEIAADGVREFLDVQVPRSGEWAGRHAVVRVVVEKQTIAELELTPGARVAVRPPRPTDTPADVVLGSTAPSLMLALWGRTPLQDVADGDPELTRDLRRFLRA